MTTGITEIVTTRVLDDALAHRPDATLGIAGEFLASLGVPLLILTVVVSWVILFAHLQPDDGHPRRVNALVSFLVAGAVTATSIITMMFVVDFTVDSQSRVDSAQTRIAATGLGLDLYLDTYRYDTRQGYDLYEDCVYSPSVICGDRHATPVATGPITYHPVITERGEDLVVSVVAVHNED